jgi:hypothetical protein
MHRKNFPDRRAQRREEANVRQLSYNALTEEQKIASAHARPGRSKRELARLGEWVDAA